MPDPLDTLIARLRDLADHIHLVKPVGAAVLLREAAEALIALHQQDALVKKWRERDLSLCRKADAQPTTQYAKTLADRAECYGRCADELASLQTSAPPQS